MLKTAHASANKTLEILAIDAFIGSPAASLDDCVLVEFEVKRYHKDGSRDQPVSFACGSPPCPTREMSGCQNYLGFRMQILITAACHFRWRHDWRLLFGGLPLLRIAPKKQPQGVSTLSAVRAQMSWQLARLAAAREAGQPGAPALFLAARRYEAHSRA